MPEFSEKTLGRPTAAFLLLVLVAGLLAPVWMVAFPPLLDYPNHLASAFVLAHLKDPGYHFAEFYHADWNTYPYLALDWILIGLQHVLPVELAGRVFLSLCLLAAPLGAWFLLRQIHREQAGHALWMLPLAYNSFFLEGFLNFCLSVGIALVAIGLWLRYQQRPGLMRWCATLAAVVFLYFTHLMNFAFAGIALTLCCLLPRPRWRQLGAAWALFVPGAVFYLLATWHKTRPAEGLHFRSLDDKLESLTSLVHSYSDQLDWLIPAAFVVLLLAAWWRNAEFHWNRQWLVISLVLMAVYVAMPWEYSEGSDLDTRVLPLVFVSLLASFRVGRRVRWLAGAAVLLFALRTADVIQNFREAQPELAGLARSFEKVPRNSHVLPVVENDEDPIRRPFTHFWAYGVIRQGWLAPYLFDIGGVTPLRRNPEVDAPDDFSNLTYERTPDWRYLSAHYGYVWAYSASRFSPGLDVAGHLVYADGDLEVYQLEGAVRPLDSAASAPK